MHAIILQGNGKNYVSAVYGYYCDIDAADPYERYRQELYRPYWIVWNEEKTRLIRWHTMTPDAPGGQGLRILIVDSDQSGWRTDEEGVGCVDYLSRKLLDSFLDAERQPEEILRVCRSADADYTYTETREIASQKDIEDFLWVTGNFHDACIARQELSEDGTLYLQFEGLWACTAEIWFRGDPEYDISELDPEKYDPYWYGATVLFQDGFVWMIYGDDMTVDSTACGCSYFRARQMRYRIVPDGGLPLPAVPPAAE